MNADDRILLLDLENLCPGQRSPTGAGHQDQPPLSDTASCPLAVGSRSEWSVGMSEEGDLDLTELDQRRWVRFELPVLVCVATDEAGDQHVVPLLNEIEMASDDQRNPVVYDPDGTARVADHRGDDAAWQAISHAGATKGRWVGEKPYSGWDWLEDPEDLTAEDRYAKEEA